MGIKILVPCLDVIMIAFFQFSIRNMVFHCIFLGKRAIIIYIKTQHKDLYPVIDVSRAQPLLTFNEPEWIKQETLAFSHSKVSVRC